MGYQDALYGNIDLPEFIQELANTPQVQRLRNISQDVLPQNCMPWNIPSRFEHSIGVCSLALDVVKHNPSLKPYALLLPVAALLHDAGNPALSHLSEPFLKQKTGMDGESFLEEILNESEAGKLITKLGFSVIDVVSFVTGNTKPFSIVLNGSMDIDNLDNVSRYWFSARGEEMLFDARKISASYRFSGNDWELDEECLEETRQWQVARQSVYQIIYGSPHLHAAIMVYRAVDIAFHYGEISEAFFRLDDTGAINFLRRCNKGSAFLVEQVLAHQWYPEIFSRETTEPSARFKNLAEQYFNARNMMAEYIREHMRMPREAIGVYIGKGRDQRKIDMPFVGKDGSRRYDTMEYKPLYRIKIYVHPDFQKSRDDIEYWVKYMIA